jgi:hypothetical protein
MSSENTGSVARCFSLRSENVTFVRSEYVIGEHRIGCALFLPEVGKRHLYPGRNMSSENTGSAARVVSPRGRKTSPLPRSEYVIGEHRIGCALFLPEVGKRQPLPRSEYVIGEHRIGCALFLPEVGKRHLCPGRNMSSENTGSAASFSPQGRKTSPLPSRGV